MKRTIILAIAAALAISPASANSVKIERVPAARSLKPAKRALPEQMVTATNVTAALSNPVTDLARAVIIYRALAAEYDQEAKATKNQMYIDRAYSERAIANFILDACQRLDRPRIEQLAAKVKLDSANRSLMRVMERGIIKYTARNVTGDDEFVPATQQLLMKYKNVRSERCQMWQAVGVDFKQYVNP